MSMSKTTRERMATMVQKRQEEVEQRKREKQQQLVADADMTEGIVKMQYHLARKLKTLFCIERLVRFILKSSLAILKTYFFTVLKQLSLLHIPPNYLS